VRIDDVISARSGPIFSFEFFPPKTAEGEAKLRRSFDELRNLEPHFFSVTWGAGGSTRSQTISIVDELQKASGVPGMAHFTCVGSSVEELHAALAEMEQLGIRNVLTLRGDPPQGQDTFEPVPDGLEFASELAGLVSSTEHDFFIAGACYPEVHQEAPDGDTDMRNLRAKVEAGVQYLITQLFFDNSDYFAFCERARAAGIDVPIVPGILPITDTERLRRFTALCGASIPPAVDEALQECGDNKAAVEDFGIAYGAEQCAELLAGGAPGIHFYTLNDARAVSAIMAALKATRPWDRYREAAFAARAG
jgi:methylenetetrahydrofolate reductase (NADPH)